MDAEQPELEAYLGTRHGCSLPVRTRSRWYLGVFAKLVVKDDSTAIDGNAVSCVYTEI